MLPLNTVDDILKALNLGQIAFNEAVRMLLALKAQGKATDEEIYEKTQRLIVEGRSLLDTLGNASLREDGDEPI